jgi:hypothetical protein
LQDAAKEPVKPGDVTAERIAAKQVEQETTAKVANYSLVKPRIAETQVR